ncbi:hypothetical protein [Amycolatopsis sp. NPDC059657]|uniref:hypothetical protein n=1 Tax=Amycolatopsis sp. NPDC059657 TaxID=3346899 RepID=UPI00366AAA67
MDSQRAAFLEGLEADLTTSEGKTTANIGTVGGSRRIREKVGALGATLFAAGSFFALSAGAASASPASPVTAQDDCMSPDYRAENQVKHCSWIGGDIQRFDYLRSYTANNGTIRCHVFNHYSWTCNNWYYVNQPEACGH